MAQAWTNTAVDADGNADNQVTDRSLPLHRLYVHNGDAGVRYVHVFDAEHGNVTPASDAGEVILAVPAGEAHAFELGLTIDDGITIIATDSAAAGGTAATAVSVVAVYG